MEGLIKEVSDWLSRPGKFNFDIREVADRSGSFFEYVNIVHDHLNRADNIPMQRKVNSLIAHSAEEFEQELTRYTLRRHWGKSEDNVKGFNDPVPVLEKIPSSPSDSLPSPTVRMNKLGRVVDLSKDMRISLEKKSQKLDVNDAFGSSLTNYLKYKKSLEAIYGLFHFHLQFTGMEDIRGLTKYYLYMRKCSSSSYLGIKHSDISELLLGVQPMQPILSPPPPNVTAQKRKQFMAKFFEQKAFLNGIDINTMDSKDIFQAIARKEAEIRDMEHIQTQPLLLKNTILNSTHELKTLIEYMDNMSK